MSIPSLERLQATTYDVTEILEEVSDFSRRNPETNLGPMQSRLVFAESLLRDCCRSFPNQVQQS